MAAEYTRGQVIPGTRYEFLEPIGEGGHGSVWLVRHTFLDETCAMKVLHSELGAHADLAARMEREARTIAKLKHPNIVRVLDGGITSESPPRPWFVMEALQGLSLRKSLRMAGRVGPLATLPTIIALLEALEFSHRAGVIHRDMKPDNVFMHRAADGITVPKLLDFGIALLVVGRRLTGKFILGTPRYIAPEQLRGDTATPATDIYAIGLILYEMLTGRAPYDHLKDPGALWNAHLNDALPPLSRDVPGVHPALQKAVTWFTAKDPTARPPTAFAAAVALREARKQIEAAQKGAIHTPEFRTEPTPMDNILTQHGPDELAQVTEVPVSGSDNDTVPGAPPTEDHADDSPFDTTAPAAAGPALLATAKQGVPKRVASKAAGTLPLGVVAERRPSVDRGAATREAREEPAVRRPKNDTAPMSAPRSAPAPKREAAPAIEPERAAGGQHRTTDGVAIPGAEEPKPPPARKRTEGHGQLLVFALTLLVVVVFGGGLVIRRERASMSPSAVPVVAAPAPPVPSIAASSFVGLVASVEAAAVSPPAYVAESAATTSGPAASASASVAKTPTVRTKAKATAPRPAPAATIDPSSIGF